MASFGPAVETARYIDGLGVDTLARSAAYTAGTHWLILGELLVAALVTWVIVRTGLLERISVRLQRRSWAARTWIVCTVYFLVSALISLPWTIFAKWGYEGAFDRTNQTLTDFLSQTVVNIAISGLISGLFFLGVYFLMRKAGRAWWIWSGGLAAFTVSALLLFAPIVIEPLFNEYRAVPEGPVKTALTQMADEAGIDHDRILMFDGSRQSNNFTANVTGVLGSGRIAISDVALDQASLDEVIAVTGHEIGHYVLGHVWRFVALFSVLTMIGFYLANRFFARVSFVFGSDAGIGDPKGLPVLLFLVSVLATLAQPALNGVARSGENEADAYSLRTVNQPDALARALVRTADYRYPRPSTLQEILFYTHPSVERRVHAAMTWKAANQDIK
jgi:STE24 endopeptidase